MRTVDSPTHKFSFLFSTLTNSWKFLSGTTSYFLQQHPLHQTTAADLLSFPISVRERFVCNQAKKPAPDPSAVRPTYQNPTLFLKLFSMPSSNQPSVYQPQHNLLDPKSVRSQASTRTCWISKALHSSRTASLFLVFILVDLSAVCGSASHQLLLVAVTCAWKQTLRFEDLKEYGLSLPGWLLSGWAPSSAQSSALPPALTGVVSWSFLLR